MMTNINNKDIRTQINFVLIGARGSGKTMYVASLHHEKIAIPGTETLNYVSKKADYYNSIDDNTKKRRCSLPPSPDMFKYLYFQYQHDLYGSINFEIADYDGYFTETISLNKDLTQEEVKEKKNRREELKKTLKNASLSDKKRDQFKNELAKIENELNIVQSKENRDALLKSVEKAEGILFFIPFEEEDSRLKDFVNEIGEFIKLAQFNSTAKSPLPASIVVTKWDTSGNLGRTNEKEKAREYIEKNPHISKAFKLINNYFSNVEIIPVSVCKNHNLSTPIDYSLEIIFKRWYSKVLDYKKDRKHKKLLEFLSKRFNDIRHNEKFDFVKEYNEIQKLYIENIKKELLKKNNYQEKEKYLNNVSVHYKTKSELLKPLFEEVGKERKRVLFRKRRNKTVATLAFISVVAIIWQYANRLEVGERYNKIIDNYEKNVSYTVLKKDLMEFLEDYKNVSPMYAFADIPSKRDRIQKIENDLKEKNRKSIEEQIEDIMNDPKLSAAEKQREIDKLRPKVADDSQKSDLENESKQLALETNTEQWFNDANNCLKNCKGKQGIGKLDKLLLIAKDSTKVISNNKVNEKVAQLIDKKKLLNQSVDMQNIFSQIESAQSSSALNSIISTLPNSFQNDKKIKDKIIASYLNFIGSADSAKTLSNIVSDMPKWVKSIGGIKQKFIASYLSILNEIDSLDQLTDTVALVPDFIFTDRRVHDKAISVVQSLHTEDFHTYRGNRLLDELKSINTANDFNKYIKQDIGQFIIAKEQYRELLKEISNKVKYEDLQSIDYSAYDSFENFEKENIKTALTNSINKSFNALYGEKPYDKFQLMEISLWLENIKKIDGFTISAIGYTYVIPSDKKASIESTELEYIRITDLKNYGISGISVTLIGKENNSLEFQCGWNHLGRRDDISISGFSSNLDYESASQCQNDSITYDYTITLKATSYNITLTDPGLKDDILSGYVYFNLQDLYRLDNYETISETIDNGKLELKFRKSGY